MRLMPPHTKFMRIIKKRTLRYPALEDDANLNSQFVPSLCGEAVKKFGTEMQAYLLSFHEDGLVWGILENGMLETSAFADSPSPQFRPETLQECRLFSAGGELLVWRISDGQFKARWIIDEEGEETDSFDEAQVLHGTQVAKGKNGQILTNGRFTVVADGSQGLRHACPMALTDKDFTVKGSPANKSLTNRPLRLRVRHYLDYDQDGSCFVSLSRLVGVQKESPESDPSSS
jgi:CRISPR-associated protein (TIGR03984 family)